MTREERLNEIIRALGFHYYPADVVVIEQRDLNFLLKQSKALTIAMECLEGIIAESRFTQPNWPDQNRTEREEAYRQNTNQYRIDILKECEKALAEIKEME